MLHGLSFHDDPTRAIRAERFAARFGGKGAAAGGGAGASTKDAAGVDLGARKCIEESLEVHRTFWRSLRRAPPPSLAPTTGAASMPAATHAEGPAAMELECA